MKDLKYIIKRIIIGVGIVFVLSCLNGCKVKALTLFDGTEVPDVPSFIINNDYPFYISFYNATELRLIYQTSSNLKLSSASPNGWVNGTIYSLPITVSNGNIISVGNNWSLKGTIGQGYGIWWRSDTEILNSLNNVSGVSTDYKHTYFDRDILLSNNTVLNNFSLYSAYLPSQAPEFISFNAIPITTNNVITSYTIQPEFSNFDTDNYVYQYSFDTNIWLSLTENEQILRINNNSTIYVRVKDKNTDEYIDGETLIISSIGTFFNNQTYDIKFSGEYRTENYLNNNISSKSQSIVKEYQIYIDYLPKSSILKYQYQYVNNGGNLDDNNWQNVSISDNASITYVATENGTLFARILDSDDNVLKSSTLTVNSIGLLAFDNNEEGINNFYDKLRNKINFGGPIGSLVNIPVTLLQTISNAFVGSTGICTDYSLGNLWGSNLVIPCVNIKQHLGNDLYNIIDIICSCTMFYMIVKMLTNAYYKFLLMEHTPVNEHIGRDY